MTSTSANVTVWDLLGALVSDFTVPADDLPRVVRNALAELRRDGRVIPGSGRGTYRLAPHIAIPPEPLE